MGLDTFALTYYYRMTPPSSPEPKTVKMAPLEIRTTPSMGIPVPIGAVMNQLRTNPNQAVVADEATGLVALVTKNVEDVLEQSTLLDTTVAGVSIFS